MTTGSEGHDVMMGDLVLTEDEVNPVMSALLDNGLEVTALHNHFFWEQPRIFYMHVHGMGTPAELATKLKPALAIIDQAVKSAPAGRRAPAASGLDAAAIAKTVGHAGEQSGPVYKITSGGPTSTCASTAPRSTRGWDSIRGRRSPAPTATRWSPATSRCWRGKCSPC